MRYLSGMALFIACAASAAPSGNIPECGRIPAMPRASAADATHRPCPTGAHHYYKPRYKGVAYDMLREESRACFVPDLQFQLLDSVIDDVRAHLQQSNHVDREYALAVSAAIGDALTRRGFAFYTPVDTLSDTLETRSHRESGAELHVFDCDTSALIYVTVAQNLRLPMTMAEIVYFYGDSDHSYVRWKLHDGSALDWDTNGRAECRTPSGQPPEVGRAMTEAEVNGYAALLTAEAWERAGQFDHALQSLNRARRLYPASAKAANNFAWLVATREFKGRAKYTREAVREAERAVKLVDKPNHLDTLACAYALSGDFARAVKAAEQAFEREPDSGFRNRVLLLKAGRDCTGE